MYGVPSGVAGGGHLKMGKYFPINASQKGELLCVFLFCLFLGDERLASEDHSLQEAFYGGKGSFRSQMH